MNKSALCTAPPIKFNFRAFAAAFFLALMLFIPQAAHSDPFTGKIRNGEYFDAILKGSSADVYALDRKYTAELWRRLEGSIRGGPFSKVFSEVTPNSLSMLTIVLTTYVQNYQDIYKNCLQPDDVLFSIITTRTRNGVPQSSTRENYRVSKKFVSHVKDLFPDNMLDNKSMLGDMLFNDGRAAAIADGTAQVMSSWPCDSENAKIFERNLITLYEKFQRDDLDPYAAERRLQAQQERQKELKRRSCSSLNQLIGQCAAGRVSKEEVATYVENYGCKSAYPEYFASSYPGAHGRCARNEPGTEEFVPFQEQPNPRLPRAADSSNVGSAVNTPFPPSRQSVRTDDAQRRALKFRECAVKLRNSAAVRAGNIQQAVAECMAEDSDRAPVDR